MNIPKGYKIVPTEPTEAMHHAARDWSIQRYGKAIGSDASRGCYSVMLAAAPTPPQPIYDESKERKLFESYASTHYRLQELPLDFEDGEYVEPEVQYSWESWEARAKSVEVGHE